MKAMKAMKKVSYRTLRRHVLAGKTVMTKGSLKKGDLVKNSRGSVVSKKKQANPWIAACSAARKALGIKGFVVAQKGSEMYERAKELHVRRVLTYDD